MRALPRQPVQMRRLHKRLALQKPQRIVPVVVAQDEDNVARFPPLLRACRWRAGCTTHPPPHVPPPPQAPGDVLSREALVEDFPHMVPL